MLTETGGSHAGASFPSNSDAKVRRILDGTKQLYKYRFMGKTLKNIVLETFVK